MSAQPKPAKQHLSSREELFTHLAKTQALSHIGSWELDLLENSLWWSLEVYKIFELDPLTSPASYESFLAVIHPQDRELLNQAFTESIEQRSPYNLTHRLLMPDGRIKYVHESGMTAYAKDGTPLRTVGTVQDVTEVVAASSQLEAKESRLSSILNALPYGIQENDLEGTITFSNKAHRNILGYAKGELVGRKIWDFSPTTQDMADTRDYLTHIIADRPAPSPIIANNLTKTGEQIWVRIDWSYRYDGAGNLVGLTSIVTDISGQKEMENRLADTEFEWTEAINQAEQQILILDADKRVRRGNRAFYNYFGLTHNQACCQKLSDLPELADNDLRPLIRRLADLASDGASIVQKSERGEIFELQCKTLQNEAHNRRGYLITLTDVTDLQRLNRRIELFAAIFENTAEGIMLTDADKRIVQVNDAFRQITGFSQEDAVGKTPALLSSGRHTISFYKEMWKTIKESGRWSGEIWNRKKSGAVFPELLTINSLQNEQGEVTHYVGIFSDISKLKTSQEKLKHLTHYDPLTDLPNRALLVERVEQALRHANRTNNRVALVMLDLDRFKHINESYGHTVGDKLIADVANNLRQVVRDDDTLARIGGDEFVLLFEDVEDISKLGFVTERIQRALALPIELPDQIVNMTASMGVCVYPEDGANASELIRNADAAMFHAKAQGRNTYQFYTEELTRKAFEVLLLENDLRQAIERNEFVLYYQPQIDMLSGKVIGAEALIRWNHKVLGTVSPARFIPIAEESGLILEIGDWVLEEGCRQMGQWQQSGVKLNHLAVNVAALQLTRGGLVTRLGALLKDNGLVSRQIELEVTEGFVMDRSERSISQLRALRELGVTIAIDDFGTGYSSLSYLKDLPMNKLKIDQSFVRGLPEDSADVALTKTIVELGTGLGMEVIAEGVETQEQAAFLTNEGCHNAQGYLFGKPMPADEFEAFWKASVNGQGSV